MIYLRNKQISGIKWELDFQNVRFDTVNNHISICLDWIIQNKEVQKI